MKKFHAKSELRIEVIWKLRARRLSVQTVEWNPLEIKLFIISSSNRFV